MKKIYFTLIGTLVLICSCDCIIMINGKVISSETGKPIIGAQIEMVDKGLNSTTDKNGDFVIGEMTGFCYPPRIKVTYKKHKPFEIELESKSDFQNYKLKKELEYIEYDVPYYPNPYNRKTFILGTWIEKYSKNFNIKSDSLIIYLDKKDSTEEIELIKKAEK